MKLGLIVRHVPFALAFASLVCIGCGKKDDAASGTTTVSGAAGANAPKGGSCNQSKDGLCTEFTENPLGASEVLCTSMLGGTYSKAACPRDNLLGTCQSKTDATLYYFGNTSGPWVGDATDSCKTVHEGTFTPVAGVEEKAKANAIPSTDRIGASCIHSDGTCDDIVGDKIGTELAKSMCSGNGTWIEGKACSTADVVASCLGKGRVTRYTAASMKKSGVTMKMLTATCNFDGMMFNHLYPTAGANPAPGAAPAGAKAKGKK